MLAFATGALAALAVLARKRPHNALDLEVTRAVQSIHMPGYDPLMNVLCWSGYMPQVLGEVGLVVLLLVLAKRPRAAAALAVATSGIAVVGYSLKKVVNRHRPTRDLVKVANPDLDGGTLSFTAGHVQAYVSVLGFLSYLILNQERRAGWQNALLGVFSFLIALIGPSRLYEGAHWFTDILGGYLFGFIWLIVAVRLYESGTEL